MYNQMQKYDKLGGMLAEKVNEEEVLGELLKDWISTSDYLINSYPLLDKELAGEFAMQFTKDLKNYIPNKDKEEKPIQWRTIGGLFFLHIPSMPIKYSLENTRTIVLEKLGAKLVEQRRAARQAKFNF